MGDVEPLLGVYKGLVVVFRGVWGCSGEAKLIICDNESRLLWYMVKKRGFKGVLKSGRKVQIFISDLNNGVW